MPVRPEAVSTGSTQSLHDAPSGTVTPASESRPGSPLGFQIPSLPGSRPASPNGYSTPGSSRPPSPLLRAMANLSMSQQKQEQDEAEGDKDAADKDSKRERRPSESVAEGLSRKGSLKAPIPRRGSSPALAPFLAKYDEFTGDGKTQKICVIGSGSWGTALARLAAVNAEEKDGCVSFPCSPEERAREADSPPPPAASTRRSASGSASARCVPLLLLSLHA